MFNQNIYKEDPYRVITEAIINKYFEMEKFRRFKVGCNISECTMSELIFLDNIFCSNKCYIGKKELETIEQKIRRYEQ